MHAQHIRPHIFARPSVGAPSNVAAIGRPSSIVFTIRAPLAGEGRGPRRGPNRDLVPNPSLFPEASRWVGCGIPSAGLSAVGRGRCRSGIGRAAPWNAPLAIGRPGGPDASGDAANQRSRRRDGAQRGCKRRLTARIPARRAVGTAAEGRGGGDVRVRTRRVAPWALPDRGARVSGESGHGSGDPGDGLSRAWARNRAQRRSGTLIVAI